MGSYVPVLRFRDCTLAQHITNNWKTLLKKFPMINRNVSKMIFRNRIIMTQFTVLYLSLSLLIIATTFAFGTSVASTCTNLDTTGSNHQVHIIDGLFSPAEVHTLSQAVSRLAYVFGEKDFETAKPSGAVCDLNIDMPDDKSLWSVKQKLYNYIYERVHPIATELIGNGTLRLLSSSGILVEDNVKLEKPYRAYVNLFRRGDHPMTHRDAPLGALHLTALIYSNDYWKRDWGAETMFFNEGYQEIFKAVRPRPGRVVFFTGGIMHTARPPLPGCDNPRYSIAIKWNLKQL